ncbi:hypothetical protein GOBAR_AA30613 [Gossypium barbadense]|uniref:Purine permease n=1 Tax=Gossypium barbadense TaxID=3634 RepID=A0A2P5WG49_GOSBA|nr:hypothetical protein GOBAR_AA30613 [Gossypium barbadense]
MGKTQEVQLHIIVQEVKEENSPQYQNSKKLASHEPRNYKWWISIIMYAFFVIFGQSASTLLGRLYYDKGGKSVWVATLAQLAGFPIVIPCYCLAPPKSCTKNEQIRQPSAVILALVYFSFASHVEVSKGKYAIGFICTIGASGGYGLMLSLTQLTFRKLLKGETHAKVFEMVIYQSLVAASAAILGLFISGEWKGLSIEVEEFELGKFSYAMTLIETAIASQLFVIGTIGLIFKVSSLFSNAISVLGLPVIPILAVIFFHDKMDAVKAIAMV